MNLRQIKERLETAHIPWVDNALISLSIMTLEELQALRQEIKDAASVRPEVDGAGISGSSTAETTRSIVNDVLQFNANGTLEPLRRTVDLSSPSVDDDDSIRELR
jgi:cell division protein ZapA (FtsZ GTPase activity inhibitor)